jgi:hypothetical protein
MKRQKERQDVFSKDQVSKIIQLEDQMTRDPGNEEKSKQLVMLYAVKIIRN